MLLRYGGGAVPAGGRRSLEVRYGHLSKSEAILSMWLADSPRLMLDLFSQVGVGGSASLGLNV